MVFMLVTWGVFCVWTLGYNALHAADTGFIVEEMVLGLPRWVFFGIALPWVCATAVTILFALFFMKDEDWSADGAEAD